MPMIDLLGYLAGIFLLMMASMRTQIAMRVCNMAGNICFIAYGFMAGVMPVFILNIVIMALHFWRIVQEQRKKTAEDSVAAAKALVPNQPSSKILYRGTLYERVDAA